ncbi:helix-turn-helix domain-containing protein [Parasediminibacterium paludis]|uniref:Helix-turn-helix domain-containing protein n=1 Tax=Parasediminibacterium paludis TaxID=908966 RepID=A0ABV8Q1E9_9BACT
MATSTLKILREVNDYSQDFVAEDILGISQPTYARLEQNPSKITAEQAQKLSDLYKVSIANLLSESTPVITFKQVNENNNSNNGYFGENTSNYHGGEVAVLKEQNAILIKQNAELMELVKVLGGKLAG